MTPTRKPYGWVFCPMNRPLLACVELDHDVGDALGDPGRPAHRTRPPPTVELVRRLVDGRLADEEGVDVGAVLLRVGHRALDDLLDHRRPALLRELEQLDRLGRVAAAHEIGDHPRLARRDPREPRTGFASHFETPLVARPDRAFAGNVGLAAELGPPEGSPW